MSTIIFFHNLSKQIVNMTELETVALNSDSNDIIMYTRSGNAILFPLEGEYIKALNIQRDKLKEEEAKEDDYHQTS